MIFTADEQRDMIHCGYVFGACADAVEFMPGNETEEALEMAYGHLSPADPPPNNGPVTAAEWRYQIEHDAGWSTFYHERFGPQALQEYLEWQQLDDDDERE